MALIGGVRLANALTSGNISGSCLQTLLGTASRNADFETLLQSHSYSCYLGTSNAASSALVNSNLAHDMISTANIGGAVLYSSPDFANNFANSTCAFQKLMCDDNVFRFFSTSPVSITCAFGNSNSVFNTTVIQSNTYVCRVVSNSTLRTCLFTNAGSVDALASNPNTAAALFSDPYLSPLFIPCGTSVCLAFNSPAWIDFGKGGNSTTFLRCCQISQYAGKTPLSAICYLLDSCAANTIVNNSTCGYDCGKGRNIPNNTLAYFVCGANCGYPAVNSPYVMKCLNCLLACGASVPLLNEMFGINNSPSNFGTLIFCHELMTRFACSCTCFYGGYCNANTNGILPTNWWKFQGDTENNFAQCLCYFPGICKVFVGDKETIGIDIYTLACLDVCTANTTFSTPPLDNFGSACCRPLTPNEIRVRISCGFERISRVRSCIMTSANNGNFIMFGPGFRNLASDLNLGGDFQTGSGTCENITTGICGTHFGVFSQHCCHCSLKTCGLLLCPMLYTKNAGRKWDIICVCIPSTIYNCRSCGIQGSGQGCGLQDHYARHAGNCGFLSTCVTSAFACENDIWVGFVIRPYGAPCTGEITGYVYGCVAANNDPVWLCWNADCGGIPTTAFTYCCGFFTGFGPSVIKKCGNGNYTTCGPRAWTHNSSCNSGMYSWNYIVGKINHTFAPQSILPEPYNASFDMRGLCPQGVSPANLNYADIPRWMFCGTGTTHLCGNGADTCGWPCTCKSYPDYFILDRFCTEYGPLPGETTASNQCPGLPTVKTAIMCCYKCCDRARIWAFNYDPARSHVCLNTTYVRCIGVIAADVCCGAVTWYVCGVCPGCKINPGTSFTTTITPPVAVFALANTLMYLSSDMGYCANLCPYVITRTSCSYTHVAGGLTDWFQGFDDNMSACFAMSGCSECGGIAAPTYCGGLHTTNSCGSRVPCGQFIGNQRAAIQAAGTARDFDTSQNWDITADYSAYAKYLPRGNYTIINPEKCTFLSMWPQTGTLPCGGRTCGLSCCGMQALFLAPNDFMSNTCFCTILLCGCSSHLKIGENAISCFGNTAGRNIRPLMYIGGSTGSDTGETGGWGCGTNYDYNTHFWVSHTAPAGSCRPGQFLARPAMQTNSPIVAFCNFMPIPAYVRQLYGIPGGYPNVTCKLSLAISGIACGQESIYCNNEFHLGFIPSRYYSAFCGGIKIYNSNVSFFCTSSECTTCLASIGANHCRLYGNYIHSGANSSPMTFNLYRYPYTCGTSLTLTTPNGMFYTELSDISNTQLYTSGFLAIRLNEAFVQVCGI